MQNIVKLSADILRILQKQNSNDLKRSGAKISMSKENRKWLIPEIFTEILSKALPKNRPQLGLSLFFVFRTDYCTAILLHSTPSLREAGSAVRVCAAPPPEERVPKGGTPPTLSACTALHRTALQNVAKSFERGNVLHFPHCQLNHQIRERKYTENECILI